MILISEPSFDLRFLGSSLIYILLANGIIVCLSNVIYFLHSARKLCRKLRKNAEAKKNKVRPFVGSRHLSVPKAVFKSNSGNHLDCLNQKTIDLSNSQNLMTLNKSSIDPLGNFI